MLLTLSPFALHADCEIKGEVSALFGVSGAGKSSILELIAGLRRPQAGTIRLDGETLVDVSQGIFVPAARRRIGYVTQDDTLFPHLSVERNLRYGERREAEGASHDIDRVITLLELRPMLGRSVKGLSGGERRRVSLGRALLCKPRLLLLDEPLAGLDASFRDRVLSHLRVIRTEFFIPIIYVTHHVDEVLALCDEVLLVEAGRVSLQGTPRDLFPLSETEPYSSLARS